MADLGDIHLQYDSDEGDTNCWGSFLKLCGCGRKERKRRRQREEKRHREFMRIITEEQQRERQRKIEEEEKNEKKRLQRVRRKQQNRGKESQVMLKEWAEAVANQQACRLTNEEVDELLRLKKLEGEWIGERERQQMKELEEVEDLIRKNRTLEIKLEEQKRMERERERSVGKEWEEREDQLKRKIVELEQKLETERVTAQKREEELLGQSLRQHKSSLEVLRLTEIKMDKDRLKCLNVQRELEKVTEECQYMKSERDSQRTNREAEIQRDREIQVELKTLQELIKEMERKFDMERELEKNRFEERLREIQKVWEEKTTELERKLEAERRAAEQHEQELLKLKEEQAKAKELMEMERQKEIEREEKRKVEEDRHRRAEQLEEIERSKDWIKDIQPKEPKKKDDWLEGLHIGENKWEEIRRKHERSREESGEILKKQTQQGVLPEKKPCEAKRPRERLVAWKADAEDGWKGVNGKR